MAEYIEREALVHHFMTTRQYLTKDLVMDAAYEVSKFPAADVAPVVHGEWVVCGDGENVPWMCSHCGKTTAHNCKVMYGNYCPYCGARMDGE